MLRSKLLWLGMMAVAVLAYYFYDQTPPVKSEVKPVVKVAVAPITARPFEVQAEEEEVRTSSKTKPAKQVSEEPPSRTEEKPKNTQSSEGRVATAAARASISSVVPNPTASKTAAPTTVKVAPPSISSTGPQVTDLPAVTAPSVATSPKDSASRQALLDRAQYWERHGRSDLAEAARNQLKQAERGTTSVKTESRARPELTDRPAAQPRPILENADKPSAVKPTQQQLLERAQYWEAHGRSDLAEALRNQQKQTERGTVVESVKTEPRGRVEVVADRPAAKRRATSEKNDEVSTTAVRPTQQQLLERAQYWESHGRTDLAEQIKQKLKTMESALPVANAARAESSAQTREDSSVARSALEDSLLKNPNSVQARLDLAQIYRSSGEMARARMQIDSVLKTNPDMPEALFSSAQLFSDQRLWMQTLHALEKVSPSARNAEMANLQKTAWAHVQIDRADTLVKQGNSAQAEVLLRQVALELAISAKQAPAEEPPALWKNSAPKKPGKK